MLQWIDGIFSKQDKVIIDYKLQENIFLIIIEIIQVVYKVYT